MPRLLIDGDGILYRAGFATEKTLYLVETRDEFFDYEDAVTAKEGMVEGDILWSRKDIKPVEDATMLAGIILRDIKDRYPNHKPEIYLSPSVGNFRDLVAKRAKYKGNRDASVRPKHYKAIGSYLVDKCGAVVAVGQEADDELSIGMSETPGSVCVSFDKDLLQVPGIHYDWVKKEEVVISKKEGALNFWVQVIAGDSVDNVPGIEGLGPVKAKALLSKAKDSASAEAIALKAYVDKYGEAAGREYFNETKALVWCRRERSPSGRIN